jgi:hypothetical protein
MPLSQLCVDIGPALSAILAEANQPVVNEHDHQADHCHHDQNCQHHGFTRIPQLPI